MNVKEYAEIVLKKADVRYTQSAIQKLKQGIKYEEKWNDHHRSQVAGLIKFLEAGEQEIDKLPLYLPPTH